MANRIRPSVSRSSVRQTSFRWSLDREVAPSRAENADPNGTWQPKFSKDSRGPIASSPVLTEDATWDLVRTACGVEQPSLPPRTEVATRLHRLSIAGSRQVALSQRWCTPNEHPLGRSRRV
jgi:hypothetical protein